MVPRSVWTMPRKWLQRRSPKRRWAPAQWGRCQEGGGSGGHRSAKGNWKMAVAVVDTGGVLVYYEKMDNTQIGSADVAIEKARTAVRFKRPSKAFQDTVAGG